VTLKRLAPAALLCAVTLIQACSSLPPERRLVDDVIAVLGGRSVVEGVKTLRIEGGGTAYLLGQVPVHGARESFADMVKTIKAKARA